MKIKFWGVRGSIATPLRPEAIRSKIMKVLKLATISDIMSEETINSFIDSLPYSLKSTYGGNTTCVEVIGQMGDTLIIDCGSGIRELGLSMMQRGFGQGNNHASIFLSHTHWDHIQGLPFFIPIFIPGNSFTFYSAYNDLEERLKQQQNNKFFPVSLEQMPAEKKFVQLDPEKEYELKNNLFLYLKRLIHPGGSYGLRVREGDKRFVFASDSEFNFHTIENIDNYKEIFDNADILVFDTQYTFEDALQKIDWGHSNSSIAIDIATRFHVKKLILFHHDPAYDDKKIEKLYIKALRYRDMLPIKTDLEIIPAHEGLELNL